jgi:hypothetical protein
MPTEKAIWADRFIPRLLDHYLGRSGFSSQQTSEPEDPNRPNNLWETVPGDYGAHGRFDDRAQGSSAQLWATLHRVQLAMGASAAAVAGLMLVGWISENRH